MLQSHHLISNISATPFLVHESDRESKIIRSAISSHVPVNFTRFEKHSWFSMQPVERATHDNQLCFVNTGNAFVHLHCSTQSIMQKSAVFSLCSYTSPSSISDWSCEKKKNSNCMKPFICIGVRFVQEIWTSVFISRSGALWRAQLVAEKPSLLQNLSSM